MKASNEAFSKTRREELALGPTGRRPKAGCRTAKITVTIRKKPAPDDEKDTLQVASKNTVILNELRKELSGLPQTTPHEFVFDRIYDEKCTNLQIYRSCIQSLVQELFLTEGTRCSCFAFGQTGSGKTYTMMGNLKSKGGSAPLNPAVDLGLYEWATKDLIEWINKAEYQDYGLYVSFFEIHCNKAYDLLNPDRQQVKALDSANGEGVVVKGLTISQVTDEKEMLTVIRQGLTLRSTAANSRNNESSRSHALLTVEVKSIATGATKGKIAFIDLAGSERGADTGNFGRTAQTDGAGINKSLLALKECIRAMDQGKTHIPFRDSQLTKVLRDFFIAPQGLCVMIATAASTIDCCEQTLNTLRYAQRFIAVRKNAVPCIAEDDGDAVDFTESLQPERPTDFLGRVPSHLEFSDEDDEAEHSYSEAKGGFVSSGDSSEKAALHQQAAPAEDDESSYSDKSSLLCSEEGGNLGIPRALLTKLSQRSPGIPPLEQLLVGEMHPRLRKVLPKCDKSKLVRNFSTHSSQAFEALYQQHTKAAWSRYSDLQEVQRVVLNDISALALAQVRLAMESDDVERPSIPSGGSKTAAKLMALNQEKLKFSRLVIEQQVSRLLKLSDVLNEAEIALKNHQLLEREAQKRSMEAVQYYNRNTEQQQQQQLKK